MNILPYDWKTSAPTNAHGFITKPILSSLPDGKNLKIADLGCGNGYLARLLEGMGHRISAIDSSADGIRIAKDACPSIDFRCLSLYEDLASHLDTNYDVVISSEVIEHLYDPRTFLFNARAIMKEEGTLILTTPYHGYLKNLAMAVTGKLDKHFTVGWDCGHIKFFSVKTLTAMVAEQGFRNIRFKFAGRIPYLWKSMMLCAEK
ncbi:MAG: methyltransferase domain-containing protein [Victivallaceae bacterium]|jgi:2-polyprenyl-3-methyl-5-hydroxy-6-metoxy-1,4-benzoquinol methylase